MTVPETVPGQRVAVVIVAYNDWPSLERCIGSLEAGDCRPFRIIIVDNSNRSEVWEGVRNRSGWDYLNPGRNLGFSKGVNLGMERALREGADYVLLLNPDTLVEAGCLRELLRAARRVVNPGLLGGRIHYLGAPAEAWYAGGRMISWQGVGKHFQSDRLGLGAEPVPVSYVTGCCMLIPAGVVKSAGMLNPEIFMYLDDAEYCARISRHGYRLYYVPSARLGHAVGPGRRALDYPPYYLYFSIRNKPFVSPPGMLRLWLRVFAVLLGAAKFARYGFSRNVANRKGKLLAIIHGAWDAWSDRPREESRFPQLFSRSGSWP